MKKIIPIVFVFFLISLNCVEAQTEDFVIKLAQDAITLMPKAKAEAEALSQGLTILSALENPLESGLYYFLNTIKSEVLNDFVGSEAANTISLVSKYADSISEEKEIRVEKNTGKIIEGAIKIGDSEIKLENIEFTEENNVLTLKSAEGESTVKIDEVNYILEENDQIKLDENGELLPGTRATINAKEEVELARIVGSKEELKAKGGELKIEVGEDSTKLTVKKDETKINGQSFYKGTWFKFNREGRINSAFLVPKKDKMYLISSVSDLTIGRDGRLVLKDGQFEIEKPARVTVRTKKEGHPLIVRFDGGDIEEADGISFDIGEDRLEEKGEILKAKHIKGTLEIEHGPYTAVVEDGKIKGVIEGIDYNYEPNEEDGIFQFKSKFILESEDKIEERDKYIYSAPWGMHSWEGKEWDFSKKPTTVVYGDPEMIYERTKPKEETIVSAMSTSEEVEKQVEYSFIGIKSEPPKELNERFNEILGIDEFIPEEDFKKAKPNIYSKRSFTVKWKKILEFPVSTLMQIKTGENIQYLVGESIAPGTTEGAAETIYNKIKEGLEERGFSDDDTDDVATGVSQAFLESGGKFAVQVRTRYEDDVPVSDMKLQNLEGNKLWQNPEPIGGDLIKIMHGFLIK